MTASLAEHGLMGCWLPVQRLILLDSGLTPVQRRCVLAHEISHARHHDSACRRNGWEERRADMEAARLLINPMEYATLEQINDNASWIAHELDVMPWVINGYRDWLHESGVVVQ
ncbi:MAG: ImmA/IrrE family metallo-endopeptidase [Bifidobacterium castoris]|nr:ImmA/IrrE family metallo-endopeptidase [Bifidobacterium castoris]